MKHSKSQQSCQAPPPGNRERDVPRSNPASPCAAAAFFSSSLLLSSLELSDKKSLCALDTIRPRKFLRSGCSRPSSASPPLLPRLVLVRTQPYRSTSHEIFLLRAFAVKVAAKRLPVFPFSGFDLYHHFRNEAFYDFYNLLKVRKTGRREVVFAATFTANALPARQPCVRCRERPFMMPTWPPCSLPPRRLGFSKIYVYIHIYIYIDRA